MVTFTNNNHNTTKVVFDGTEFSILKDLLKRAKPQNETEANFLLDIFCNDEEDL